MKINLQMFDSLKVTKGKLDLSEIKTTDGQALNKTITCYNRFLGFFLDLMGFTIKVSANELDDKEVVYLSKSEFIGCASELFGKEKTDVEKLISTRLHDTVMQFFAPMRQERLSRWEYSVNRRDNPTLLPKDIKEKVDAFEEHFAHFKLVELMIEIAKSDKEHDFSEAKQVTEHLENPKLKERALELIAKAEEQIL